MLVEEFQISAFIVHCSVSRHPEEKKTSFTSPFSLWMSPACMYQVNTSTKTVTAELVSYSLHNRSLSSKNLVNLHLLLVYLKSNTFSWFIYSDKLWNSVGPDAARRYRLVKIFHTTYLKLKNSSSPLQMNRSEWLQVSFKPSSGWRMGLTTAVVRTTSHQSTLFLTPRWQLWEAFSKGVESNLIVL